MLKVPLAPPHARYINKIIEVAILEGDEKGVRVMNLGLLNNLKAKEGTIFIPFSQFPPNKLREDCFYHSTPAMLVPKSAQNIDSCENWLGRRVMSGWRIVGIVHICP
ncbi:unnamed protein product [Arabidopsis halleri]